MKKPFIKSLMLGSSVDDLIEEIDNGTCLLDQDYVVSGDADAEWWRELIKLLIKSKDHNIRFVADIDMEFSETYAPKLKDLKALTYDDDSWSSSENDTRILNHFIRDFYGEKEKKPKAKITNDQYVEKPSCCPVCSSHNTQRDGGYYSAEQFKVHGTLGCNDCNAQWSEVYELSGFKNVGSR
jgi:hypothetical protein